jgi:gamma-glutamyltranspeptidase/glutathione hydrolase
MQSNVSTHGMAVAPHHLASQSALAVLREGGSAIEAMVARRPPLPWFTRT